MVEQIRINTFEVGGIQDLIDLRDESERFTAQEKLELAASLETAWKLFGREFGLANAPVVAMDDWYKRGNYSEQEHWSGSAPRRFELGDAVEGSNVYAMMRMAGEEDYLSLRSCLRDLGVNQSVVVSPFIPSSRLDRPVMDAMGNILQPRMPIHFEDLYGDGVRAIVTVDAHSPALARFTLEQGMAVLDVSVIPLLLNRALELPATKTDRICVVNGDNGSLEMGRLTRDLVYRTTGKKPGLVNGEKSREGGRVVVEFDGVERVGGTTVIIPEDMIASGGTLRETMKVLFEAGAEHVVVLASHAVFTQGAELLLEDERATIIVSDGRDPITGWENKKGLVRVDIGGALEDLVKYIKVDFDFWGENAESELLDGTGLVLSPWQTYHK